MNMCMLAIVVLSDVWLREPSTWRNTVYVEKTCTYNSTVQSQFPSFR